MNRTFQQAARLVFAGIGHIVSWTKCRRKQKRVLILTPTSTGSVGDEAIVSALISEITSHRDGEPIIAATDFSRHESWSTVAGVDRTFNLKGYFEHRPYRGIGRFIRCILWADVLYCLGTDCLDGGYSRQHSLRLVFLMELARRACVSVKLVGFSVNETPDPVCMAALNSLPDGIVLQCRDEISQARLQNRVSRPVALTVDAAFLLEPAQGTPFTRLVLEWTGQHRQAGRVVYGVNANSHFPMLVQGVDGDVLVNAYAAAMTSLFHRFGNVSYVLIPHDMRGVESDVTVADRIMAALPSDVRTYCLRVPVPFLAAEIKAVCGGLDVVFSGRMHLAIACLGMGTPVGCLAYQGKFDGLFRHFGIDGMTLPPETLLQPGEMERFMELLLARRAELAERISGSIAGVRALALKNL